MFFGSQDKLIYPKRIAILAQSAMARRFMQSLREFNREHGSSIKSLVFYTNADRNQAYIRAADEAVLVPDLGGDGGEVSAECLAELEAQLGHYKVDILWLGWGCAQDRVNIFDLCDDLGISVLGGAPRQVMGLHDKIYLKSMATVLEIPHLPWLEIDFADPLTAIQKAESFGFPLVLKPAVGVDAEGIRVVNDLPDWLVCLEEMKSSSYDLRLKGKYLIERYIPDHRIFSVPTLADRHKKIWTVGIKETLVEQDLHKLLEEMPAVDLTPELETQLKTWAARLLQGAHYEGAAGVEFLYDVHEEKPWLLDVNSRLEHSHELIEAYSGIDLLKGQILLACGGHLASTMQVPSSHYFSARLRPDKVDVPSAAMQLAYFRPASGPGVRVDLQLSEGQFLKQGHILGQIISHGQNRNEALLRLERAIKETQIVVKNGAVAKGPALAYIQSAEFTWGPGPNEQPKCILTDECFAIIAALEQYREHRRAELAIFLKGAAHGQPMIHPETGMLTHLNIGDKQFQLRIATIDLDSYLVSAEGLSITVAYQQEKDFQRILTVQGGPSFSVLLDRDESSYWIEIEGLSRRVLRSSARVIRAPSPGVVQNICVNPGQRVDIGARLLTLEAMKMELAIEAPNQGTVQKVFVVNNTPALRGTPLLLLETASDDFQQKSALCFNWEGLQAGTGDSVCQKSQRIRSQNFLRAVMLGFDIDGAQTSAQLEIYKSAKNNESRQDTADWTFEQDLLFTFIHVRKLFRKQPLLAFDEVTDHFATEDHLITYLRTLSVDVGLPDKFRQELWQALAHYGQVEPFVPDALRESLYWLYRSKQLEAQQLLIVRTLLEGWQKYAAMHDFIAHSALKVLQELILLSQNRYQGLCDLCLQLKHDWFDRPLLAVTRAHSMGVASELLQQLLDNPSDEAAWGQLIAFPYPLRQFLVNQLPGADRGVRPLLLQLLVARYYRQNQMEICDVSAADESFILNCAITRNGEKLGLFVCYLAALDHTEDLLRFRSIVLDQNRYPSAFLELVCDRHSAPEALLTRIQDLAWPDCIERIVVHIPDQDREDCALHGLWKNEEGQWTERPFFKNFHPSFADRLQLTQWQNFQMEPLLAPDTIFLFRAVARQNPKDERLVALVEVRDLTPVRDSSGRIFSLPHLEQLMSEACATIRAAQLQRMPSRLHWNLIELHVWPVLELNAEELYSLALVLAQGTEHLGLEKVLWRGPIRDPRTGLIEERVLEFSKPSGMDLTVREMPAHDQAIAALSEYEQKVLRLKQRALVYPYELIRILCPKPGDKSVFPTGSFQEYELEGEELIPVSRPYGRNTCNIVVGTISHSTQRYPEGMMRVALLGDPSRGLGNLSEPECRRIIAAIELAETLRVPVEWFALSSGAKIAMDSGTENMDWIAAALRKIVEFTQNSGEINVIVMGINVGAQPYWNAEATMLMHTKGVLIMLPQSAMVLTGKRALDYSGGVSAEDDLGIGGYSRVMGINGQAQYFAQDLAEACTILLKHYEYCYVARGERFPRRVVTLDSPHRDVCQYPHGGLFATVGQIFDDRYNPGRKKPFEIRQVMRAAVDQDFTPLERWADMRDAEVAVVWDAFLGGVPVCLLGIESKPLPRRGVVAADGPEQWTGGTLFPLASKKIARAINAASGCRPVVVLANLSGFDGSPESMRNCQLEFGAEIGRAVVNFQGPVIFCVVSRFHGGAYVVFSKTLNDNLQILALEGTYASVIGGAPAAGVVFAGEVEQRTQIDPRIVQLTKTFKESTGLAKQSSQHELELELRKVRASKVGVIAEEFDHEHSVHRALRVGSLHRIIAAQRLRPELIEALERGMAIASVQ